MIILPDCSHCHHYCYSHRMLQSASVGLTSIWAYVDICCQACLPVEWIQPRCFIHFLISEHSPCARHVTGHWRCRDRGPGSALTMVLVEGQQKRLTVCWLIYSLVPPYRPTASILGREPSTQPRAQRSVKLGPCSSR